MTADVRLATLFEELGEARQQAVAAIEDFLHAKALENGVNYPAPAIEWTGDGYTCDGARLLGHAGNVPIYQGDLDMVQHFRCDLRGILWTRFLLAWARHASSLESGKQP
jgi:hypothetical protein